MALASVAVFAADGNLSPGVREDRGNRWVLAVFAILTLPPGFVPAWSPLLVRISAEKALLREQLGAEHEMWCSRISRIVPGLF